MKHGSLFSGIGGFDLAAEWMGWHNVFHCEINDFGRKVLNHYWPNADSLEDITKTDFTKYAGTVDIISGGFPCQPYSTAGKRLGKEDERHLWPEMLRAIREIQPRWVVGENVLGLVNWSNGLVFHEVQADLETEGYEVQPFILPAAAVNAPHRRDRVWFVAKYTKCKSDGGDRPKKSRRNGLDLEGNELVQSRRKQGSNNSKPSSKDATKPACKRCNNRGDNRQERQICDNKNRNAEKDKSERNGWECRACSFGEAGNVTNSKSESSRRKYEQRQREGEFRGQNRTVITDTNGRRQSGKEYRKAESRRITKTSVSGYWQNFPTQPPICGGDDGLPRELDGITFSKWRNESIKAYGNAIVPQVVYQIFKAIEHYEITLRTSKLPA